MSKEIKNHLTIVRIMMLEVRDRIGGKVEINESTVRSLYLNLITENYETITMYHGEEFATEIMGIYSECELYETCVLIRDSISSVRELEDLIKPKQRR
jgi:hypothetical protein|tara:strand:- start:221 stop:514 length:294 start_codon:yes stop_codon:yes gene_type:complete